MRKVVLYIAMSLDGYIADNAGGVTWLKGDGSDEENPGTFQKFYDSIDTIILGFNTCNQIITELSPDNWVYSDKMTYVITHRKATNQENIIYTDDLLALVDRLKSEEGKDVWVCGGASVFNQLLERNLIDGITISVMPVILGDGVKLFEKTDKTTELKLVSTKSYNGITDLVYEKRD